MSLHICVKNDGAFGTITNVVVFSNERQVAKFLERKRNWLYVRRDSGTPLVPIEDEKKPPAKKAAKK